MSAQAIGLGNLPREMQWSPGGTSLMQLPKIPREWGAIQHGPKSGRVTPLGFCVMRLADTQADDLG